MLSMASGLSWPSFPLLLFKWKMYIEHIEIK